MSKKPFLISLENVEHELSRNLITNETDICKETLTLSNNISIHNIRIVIGITDTVIIKC